MTNEAKEKKTVNIVDWSAPCAGNTRIRNRKIFKSEGGAEAFITQIQDAAALIGIQSEILVSRNELEVH